MQRRPAAAKQKDCRKARLAGKPGTDGIAYREGCLTFTKMCVELGRIPEIGKDFNSRI